MYETELKNIIDRTKIRRSHTKSDLRHAKIVRDYSRVILLEQMIRSYDDSILRYTNQLNNIKNLQNENKCIIEHR